MRDEIRRRRGTILAAGVFALVAGGTLPLAPSVIARAAAAPAKAGGAGAPAAAASPLASYDALYGAEERRVLATPAVKDDAQFANQLIAGLKDLKDDPALLTLMCEKAYAFGVKDPDGYGAAIEAARRLRAAAAGTITAVEWRARLIDLYGLQMKRKAGKERADLGEALIPDLIAQAGDEADAGKLADAQKSLAEAASAATQSRSPRAEEIRAISKDLQARAAVLDKIAKLKARLDAKPGDPDILAQIIDAYVLELDDPAPAAALAANHRDDTLRTVLPLAALKPDKLDEDQCLQLGGWYKKLAERAKGDGKVVALSRAADYLMRFRTSHNKQDGPRLQAQRDLDDVAKELAKAGGGSRGVRIVVWNTHNSGYKDRGATAFNLVLYSGDRVSWRRDGVPIEWRADADTSATLFAPPVSFDRVRVEITAVNGHGGGLSEIEVFRNGRNVALGAAVEVSGTFQNNTQYDPANLTDGVTGSAKMGTFWVAPDGPTAWAEVSVYKPGKPPK